MPEVLGLIASVEALSEHPIAEAIVVAAKEEAVPLQLVTDFQAAPGFGVEGIVDGQKVLVGADRALQKAGIGCWKSPSRLSHSVMKVNRHCMPPSTVGWRRSSQCLTRSRKPHRRNQGAACASLKVAMITGDRKAAAIHVMTETLKHLANHCHGDERPDCPIIEEFANASHEEDVPAVNTRFGVNGIRPEQTMRR